MATTRYEDGAAGLCNEILVQPNGGAATTKTITAACAQVTASAAAISGSAANTAASTPPSSAVSSAIEPAVSSTSVIPSVASSASGLPSVQNPTPGVGNNTVNSPSGIPGGNGTAGTTTDAPKVGGSELTGGAVAGVAIGMFLAGTLIAGVIFLVLLRRQKRRQTMSAAAYSRQQAPYTERNVGREKGATVVAAPVGGIDDLLPQPAEDDAITGDLSKIRDNIKNHVRTYYHTGPISAADINEVGIHDVAALTGGSAATLAKMLQDPLTRDNALRSIVGSVILTRCTGERSPSLLPSDVAALSASMSASNGNSAQSALYSKWKVVTGALLQQRYGKQSQDHGRSQTFQGTIASLDSILAPFLKGSIDGGQRRKNLDMILTRAANFAFLLFSQPGTFRFDFTSGQGSLTVFPALVQTVGDKGQPLESMKVLTEKEVVAV